MELSQIEKMELDLQEMENKVESMKRTLQEERAKNPNFSQMTLEELIKFKSKNYAMFWDYDMHNDGNPIVIQWNKAYKVFQEKQLQRENLLFAYFSNYLAQRKGQIVIGYEMYRDVFARVYEVYNQYTPFDCEDEKWEIRSGRIEMYINPSWDSRVKLIVRRYCNFKGINFQEVRIIDRRK